MTIPNILEAGKGIINALFFPLSLSLSLSALKMKKSSKSKISGRKDRQVLGFVESEKKNNNCTTRV